MTAEFSGHNAEDDFEPEPDGPDCILCHDFSPIGIIDGVCPQCRRNFTGIMKAFAPIMSKMGEEFMRTQAAAEEKAFRPVMRGEPLKMRPFYLVPAWWAWKAQVAFRSGCFLAALYIVIREAVKAGTK